MNDKKEFINGWNDVKNPPKEKGYYLCYYKSSRKYNVFWFENGIWLNYSGGAHYPEKYEVKSVKAWKEIESPIL